MVKNQQGNFPNRESAPATETTTVFDSEFDALAEKKLKEYHVPGISCAIIKGEDVFAKVSQFIFLGRGGFM